MKATDIQKSLILSLTTLFLANCGVESVPKRGKIGTGTNPIVVKEAPKENPDGSLKNGSEKSKPIDEIEIDPNEPTPEIPEGSFTWMAICTGWPKPVENPARVESVSNESVESTDASTTTAEFYLSSEQPIVLVHTDGVQTYAVLKVSAPDASDTTDSNEDETTAPNDETSNPESPAKRTLSIEREGEFRFVLPDGTDVPTTLYRGEEKLADLSCTTPE